ncbi:COG3650 family protein [Erythrobacter mangrovi]|uniref:Lipoprotein n=1 Tax=Erythrobacter mangrovi TaxID=2739433 RepID=A0A7D4BMT2_9SPHN|nr:hypothetical protein [Erythrobacter mangrovi]QKG70504.1 hypothetical protein HQR01_03495 [Erythrobacter mangrovi]
MRFLLVLVAGATLTGCQPADPASSSGPNEAFDGIKDGETVQFTGTEPFWGGEVADGMVRYSTPDRPDGVRFAADRFAGLNGVSFSGKLDGTSFDLMVTPGTCSDGMSDRSYPFTATLRLGTETREGCAWTAASPFEGDETP